MRGASGTAPRASRRRCRWQPPRPHRQLRDRRKASGSWQLYPEAKACSVQNFVGGDRLPASGDMQIGPQQIERARDGAEQPRDFAIGVLGALDRQRDEALVEFAKLVENCRLFNAWYAVAKQDRRDAGAG